MLEDRIAVVTNAWHFVGPGSAKVLSRYGATVVCHDEEFTDPKKRSALEVEFPGTMAVAAQEPEDVVSEALSAQGRIDVLISNDAYRAVRAPVDEADPDEMRRALEAWWSGRTG